MNHYSTVLCARLRSTDVFLSSCLGAARCFGGQYCTVRCSWTHTYYTVYYGMCCHGMAWHGMVHFRNVNQPEFRSRLDHECHLTCSRP